MMDEIRENSIEAKPGSTIPEAEQKANHESVWSTIAQYIIGGDPRKEVPDWSSRSSASSELHSGVIIQDKLSGKKFSAEARLGAGDYNVEMGDGRNFELYVPKDANGSTMYVFQGSMEPKWKQEDFAMQTELNQEADHRGFSIVYIHPQKHFLGQYSTEPAWAYNAPDSLIEQPNLAQAGYNDNVYVDKVRELLPKIAEVDTNADKTAVISFSQGGAFLYQYLAKHENFAQTVGFVGTAFPQGDIAAMAKGNAENILEVNLLADDTILPKTSNKSESYLKQKAIHSLVDFTGFFRHLAEQADPLAPIRNDLIQDTGPVLQKTLAPGFSTRSLIFGNKDYDTLTIMEDKFGHSLSRIDLPHAEHAYPSRNSHRVHTDSFDSYNSPVSKYFAGIFAKYIRTH